MLDQKLDVIPSASASTLKSSHSRKPWPVSGPRSPLLACAEVNTPNLSRTLAVSSKPRNVGESRAAGMDVHAAKLGAAMQRWEHLAGVKQAFVVERALEALLLMRSASENIAGIRSRFSTPTPCSPVSTPPTSTHRRRMSAPNPRLAPIRPACWSRRGSADADCRRQRETRWRRSGRTWPTSPHSPQHQRQLGAWDGAVHTVIVRRDTADRRKRSLAAGPEQQPFLFGLGHPASDRAALPGDLLTRSNSGRLRRPGRQVRRSAAPRHQAGSRRARIPRPRGSPGGPSSPCRPE